MGKIENAHERRSRSLFKRKRLIWDKDLYLHSNLSPRFFDISTIQGKYLITWGPMRFAKESGNFFQSEMNG